MRLVTNHNFGFLIAFGFGYNTDEGEFVIVLPFTLFTFKIVK